jgi:hypothetical protein
MNFLAGFAALEIYILNFVILNESSSSSFRQKASVGTLICKEICNNFKPGVLLKLFQIFYFF